MVGRSGYNGAPAAPQVTRQRVPALARLLGAPIPRERSERSVRPAYEKRPTREVFHAVETFFRSFGLFRGIFCCMKWPSVPREPLKSALNAGKPCDSEASSTEVAFPWASRPRNPLSQRGLIWAHAFRSMENPPEMSEELFFPYCGKLRRPLARLIDYGTGPGTECRGHIHGAFVAGV